MAEQAEERSFAERLAHLIATVHPPDRKPYSYREIAQGVADVTGVSMSATHVQQLAVGARRDPKRSHIQALARFFGVPVTYFFDDEVAGRVDEQVADVLAWRDTQARDLAQRAMQLSERDRQTVSALMDQLGSYAEGRERTRRGRKPE
ncbi:MULTISPECIES: XRE family transcriptional regulator [Amycolatopsis]|uniref:XRE family transcriptional regulator n=1 Tax=Amycolatopsis dendrobii TaxID=2760662 RepID=A0A7W3W5V4_9PSEU|nr:MULTISPECIES: XRE family transcriptional regulator [Amycolatopsis]MBB1159288.1 XRE family transcriptional regulator [Amycolatopsis dendrobii]UKD58385.1 XRE family transcriptional regulator [Amycolatopsis sp. FU40]